MRRAYRLVFAYVFACAVCFLLCSEVLAHETHKPSTKHSPRKEWRPDIRQSNNALQPGTIKTSNQSFKSNVTPSPIQATPASGGNCNGVYEYQWQFSFDNTTFYDAEDAIDTTIRFYNSLFQTTYFRRKVTCGGDSAFTGTVTYTIIPAFNGGTITSGSQIIDMNAVPSSITATDPQNCFETFTYQWERSLDGYTFSTIGGATLASLSFSEPYNATTYFRRRAICIGDTAYTNTIAVFVKELPESDSIGPNPVDTSLQYSLDSLRSFFLIEQDSTVNPRREQNEFTNLEEESKLAQDLLIRTMVAADSTKLTNYINSLPLVDSLWTKIPQYSEGGIGDDSTYSNIPQISDSLVEASIANGQLAYLDSLTNLIQHPPYDEIINRAQEDTTVSNPQLRTTLSLPPFEVAAVINGPSYTNLNQVVRYYVDFLTPLVATSVPLWVVSGGTIVGRSNSNTPGNVWVDILWTSSIGMPYVGVIDFATGQTGSLNVYFFLPPCNVVPALQTIHYGQTPSILNANSCAVTNNVAYQWQVRDAYAGTAWTDIPGATASTYQPPLLDKIWLMYRRVTRQYTNTGTLMATSYSTIASVKLRTLSGGVIRTTTSIIRYNTSPNITAFHALGGFRPPGALIEYYWEYSVANGPWQVIGTGKDFPAFNLQYTNTRIRRKVLINGINSTGIPQEYLLAYSNELRFDTYYQTVDYENRNYIRENIVLTRGIQTWEGADALSAEHKAQTTTYLDGISRPEQTVAKGTHYDEGANQWYDMVQSFGYDIRGRVDKTLLPYPTTAQFGKFKTNAAADQPAYYQAKFGENTAYAKVTYEADPTNRIKKTFAPGDSWAGANAGVEGTQEAYLQSEAVRFWTIGYTANARPVSSSVYPSYELLKYTGKDEKGSKVITYVDRRGLTILKKVQLLNQSATTEDEPFSLSNQHRGWLCTYYVYDEFGQLRYTITPKAVKILDGNGWNLTQDIADGLCFSYQYDEYGRTVAKKTSDKGVEHVVYDHRNRPVFTQDPHLKAKNQWLASLYDRFNRRVITGLLTYSGSFPDLQQLVTTQTSVPAQPSGSSLPVDVVINYTTSGTRQALRSVTLDAGFESVTNADFTAEITTGTGGIDGQTTIIEGVAINKNPLPPGAPFEVLTISYFDDYDYPGAKGRVSTQLAYKDGNVESDATTKRHKGMVTGSKVKVLKSGGAPQYLISTIFYDEEGRSVQALGENVNGGVDVSASQYHFDGRVLSTLQLHTNPGTPYNNFPILTKYLFDKVGRVKGIAKKIGDPSRSYSTSASVPGAQEDGGAGYKLIATYSYNELGRRVKKVLSPQSNNGQGLESIDYDYNIRGWLTGINKSYALGGNNVSQWEHYFGMYLGYDNKDGRFAYPQYNGQITGVIWKSGGDNAQRMYQFLYDRAGRLTSALFVEGNGNGGWGKDKFDFTTDGIQYDENGNILQMRQMGNVPGTTTDGGTSSPVVDLLFYTYKPNSNQLLRVDDASQFPQYRGATGDFKDGKNAAGTDDYSYDANGNITMDNNRGISSIQYNYLDKPEVITLAPTASEPASTIRYLYDATGSKLQKTVEDNRPLTSNEQARQVVTMYHGAFVYEKVTVGTTAGPIELQSIAHEEGRIRVITPYNNPQDPANFIGGGISLPGGKQGVFDYYIKDHLSNIRAVITEEENKASSVCTMEDVNQDRKKYEEGLFGNITNNEVAGTRVAKSAAAPGWNSNSSDKVSKLFSTTTQPRIGPNVLLKVMAGDKISAQTDYYFVNNSGGGGSSTLGAVVQSLVGALSGGRGSTLSKDYATYVGGSLNNDVPLQQLYNTQSNTALANKPRAYLNYLFFDENLNFVSQGSGFQQVSQEGDGAPALMMQQVKAPKNGYVYVYLSNASTEPVYFDNFAVSHQKSPLIEEAHYYAFGLKISAISSKAVASTLNPNAVSRGYQGSFSEEVLDFELYYNEFDLRTYDPQIGRWTTPDPYIEFPSPYLGMGNDPISNVDPTGGFIGGLNTMQSMMLISSVTMVAGVVIDGSTGGNGVKGMLIGAAAPWAVFGISTTLTSLTVAGGAFSGGSLSISLQVSSVLKETIEHAIKNASSENKNVKPAWKGGYNQDTMKWEDIEWNDKKYEVLSKEEIETLFGQTGQDAENRYEGLALKAFGQKRNKTYLTREGTKPDGVSKSRLLDVYLKAAYKKSYDRDIFEIKLLGPNRNLGADAQQRSFIQDIATSPAGREQLGSLWYVTTGDNSIGIDIRIGATQAGVNVFQSVAYIDRTNPGVVYFAQWVGVTGTPGAIKYNILYGRFSQFNIGPFAGSASIR
jgi:RHS repeat-associated protein